MMQQPQVVVMQQQQQPAMWNGMPPPNPSGGNWFEMYLTSGGKDSVGRCYQPCPDPDPDPNPISRNVPAPSARLATPPPRA